MPATSQEVEDLRFHLGYGNIGIGAYPSTPDGFYELFTQVVAPNLNEGATTTGTTPVTSTGIATVTVVSMTGIAVYERLAVDVGADEEIVVVQAVTSTAFTARFAKTHPMTPYAPTTGYPVAVESGLTKLRRLLFRAHEAHERLTDNSATKSAGLKSVGRGAVEWFQGAVLNERGEQYIAIVHELSKLVRVKPLRHLHMACTRLEAY